jgi:hypothetical protein
MKNFGKCFFVMIKGGTYFNVGALCKMTDCTIIVLFSLSLSQKFSPFGRIRGVHLLCYQELAVVNYGCALECLANGRLAYVKYPVIPNIS